MNWITNNIDFIGVIALGVVNIMNATTKHFSELKGLAKAFGFVTEVLSIFTSAGSTNGRFGKLKLPLTTVHKKKVPTE